MGTSKDHSDRKTKIVRKGLWGVDGSGWRGWGG